MKDGYYIMEGEIDSKEVLDIFSRAVNGKFVGNNICTKMKVKWLASYAKTSLVE